MNLDFQRDFDTNEFVKLMSKYNKVKLDNV